MDRLPLTLADSVRYHMSTAENPMEIAVVLQLAGRMPRETLEAFVAERLLRHERFRHTVLAASWPALRPHWQLEHELDVSAHVSGTLAGPELSQAALAAVVSERLSQRMGFERSPWHFDLFPLEGGDCALLLRVHHCIADGHALVQLLAELADDPATASASVRAHRTARAGKRPLTAKRILHETLALGAAMRHLVAMRDERAPALCAAVSGKKLVASQALDLQRLRSAAQACGCHVTDLLLGAATAAVAQGLRSIAAPVPKQLRALVPFALSAGEGELGNHYASVFVELPTDAPSPRQRIEGAAATSRQLRDSSELRLAVALMALSGALTPPLMRALSHRFSHRASLVLSNVPGPTQRVALMRHPVRSILVFAPVSGDMALSFTLFSYAGELRLGVETDAVLQLRPEQLATDFGKALEELEDWGGGRGAPSHGLETCLTE